MRTRRLVHVIGARPNFMKAAPVIAACTAHRSLGQRCVHTGQHYDRQMSDIFFTELGLPQPDVNLGVGSGTHATQTAALLEALEKEFDASEPDMVVVYGDVNSTLAAALVAAKLRIPVAHVEAGLRSFDPTMPEEVNRRVADMLSDLLFATSPEAIANLAAEGVEPGKIHLVGNPMIDTLYENLHRFDPAPVQAQYRLPARYGVVTLHRPANVDDESVARPLVTALEGASQHLPLIFPVHPRGRAALQAAGLREGKRFTLAEPLGYIEFLSLVRGAAAVITDSGGIQEETTILGVPCLTMRPNTERPITISHGTNRLVTSDSLPTTLAEVLEDPPQPGDAPPLWDGKAGPRIAAVLDGWAR